MPTYGPGSPIFYTLRAENWKEGRVKGAGSTLHCKKECVNSILFFYSMYSWQPVRREYWCSCALHCNKIMAMSYFLQCAGVRNGPALQLHLWVKKRWKLQVCRSVWWGGGGGWPPIIPATPAEFKFPLVRVCAWIGASTHVLYSLHSLNNLQYICKLYAMDYHLHTLYAESKLYWKPLCSYLRS
jgi:hypothetical protein